MSALEALDLALPEADGLIVVPPLAHLTWPALGPHQLQASAREAGFRVAILYANALYARLVGPLVYAALCNAPVHWLLGDRLFARAAFGAPPLGFETRDFLAEVDGLDREPDAPARRYIDHMSEPVEPGEGIGHRYGRAMLAGCEAAAFRLAESLGQAIAGRRYAVVGGTTTFDQTAACLAILGRVKAAHPGTRTVLGGANCEADMAHGLRSLGGAVDHVFSGESEASFVSFLRSFRDGTPAPGPIVRGAPCKDLDALPTPSFADWTDQIPPELADTPLWLTYETSRGCWWGATHHCTFCGIEDGAMAFRQKSPDRVIAQLREMLATSPTWRVVLTDNIMPHAYHRTLIPRLAQEVPGIHLFYEQKANLGLAQVKGLLDAGVASIQPGMEALDSDLLRLVRKGLLARQNVALLRYAGIVGLRLRWNLLWGFPGDDAAAYRRTAALVPLLHHLQPPQAMAHLHLIRFSPYFEQAQEHGVGDLRPLPAYAEVFPPGTDLDRLAYHFTGTYACGSHTPEAGIDDLRARIDAWLAQWTLRPPVLHVRPAAPGRWLLTDTRAVAKGPVVGLDEAMLRAVLVGGPRAAVPRADWAIRNGYAADLDGWCVPLATAPYDLLAALEEDHRAGLLARA